MQPDNQAHVADVPWNEAGVVEVLTFDMGGQTFALEAALVREILDPLPETRVPGAPGLVPSVVNFRGRIVPVADLRLAFGMVALAAGADSRIIDIELDLDEEPTLLGLKTDRVHEVTTLFADTSEPPPVIGLKWRRDVVRTLVRQHNDVVVLPDLNNIFATPLAGTMIV